MNERYYKLYEEFERHFPSEKNNVVDWYVSSPNEIVVRLRNGDSMYFSGNEHRYGYIRKYEVDERGAGGLDDDVLRSEFSTKLKRVMQGRFISQKELSNLTGISVQVISRYMSGRNLPDYKNLLRICHAIGCSVSELTYFE